MMMCRFMHCDLCPTLVGDDSGGGRAYEGVGSIWGISAPSLGSRSLPQTALKDKVLIIFKMPKKKKHRKGRRRA